MKKFDLKELQVKSFLTSEKELNTHTVKGGRPISYWSDCNVCFTQDPACFTEYQCSEFC